MFGMNLLSGLEEAPGMFAMMAGGTFGVAAVLAGTPPPPHSSRQANVMYAKTF